MAKKSRSEQGKDGKDEPKEEKSQQGEDREDEPRETESNQKESDPQERPTRGTHAGPKTTGEENEDYILSGDSGYRVEEFWLLAPSNPKQLAVRARQLQNDHLERSIRYKFLEELAVEKGDKLDYKEIMRCMNEQTEEHFIEHIFSSLDKDLDRSMQSLFDFSIRSEESTLQMMGLVQNTKIKEKSGKHDRMGKEKDGSTSVGEGEEEESRESKRKKSE